MATRTPDYIFNDPISAATLQSVEDAGFEYQVYQYSSGSRYYYGLYLTETDDADWSEVMETMGVPGASGSITFSFERAWGG